MPSYNYRQFKQPYSVLVINIDSWFLTVLIIPTAHLKTFQHCYPSHLDGQSNQAEDTSLEHIIPPSREFLRIHVGPA
jgi:hypothetical protein